MKFVCTVEARMTSSRLPGKVMLPANGEPMLAHLVRRLKLVKELDAIVIATTTNPLDNPICELATKMEVEFFRGSENDVMERVIKAAESANGDVVVEITADCPLIDIELIRKTIALFKATKCDYASNVIVRGFPDGMDVQVIPLTVLKKSFSLTSESLDREHVTRHIRLHPEVFRHEHLIASAEEHAPELAITLDENSDYLLIKKIFEHLGDEAPTISCKSLVKLIKDRPEWRAINDTVIRKGLS